jgi:hypothetical protein
VPIGLASHREQGLRLARTVPLQRETLAWPPLAISEDGPTYSSLVMPLSRLAGLEWSKTLMNTMCHHVTSQERADPDKKPLVSIVIPTKNRWKYAHWAIMSALELDTDEVEVVVLDTSDDGSVGAAFADSIADRRLVYRWCAPPMDIIITFNAAVDLARGHYVCLIGDDDAVLPKIVDVARVALERNIDVLSTRGVSYQWPDFRSRYFGDLHAGKVYVEKYTSKAWYGNLEQGLHQCAMYSYKMSQITWLPRVYGGLVRKSVIETSRSLRPDFFAGVCPDIYGVIAAASFATKWCIADYPLILPGSSAASTAGMSSTGKHSSELSEVEHFKAFAHLDWPAEIPRFWTVETVWAAGAWVALRDHNREDLLKRFDLSRVYAQAMIANVGDARRLMQCIREAMNFAKSEGFAVGWPQLARALFLGLVSRASQYARRLRDPRPSAGAAKVFDAANTYEAVHILTELFSHDGWSLGSALHD